MKRRPVDARLWRRFSQLAALPPQQRRQILQVLDSLLEAERLKRKVGAA